MHKRAKHINREMLEGINDPAQAKFVRAIVEHALLIDAEYDCKLSEKRFQHFLDVIGHPGSKTRENLSALIEALDSHVYRSAMLDD